MSRNENFLDNPTPEDDKIGELLSDESGQYRIVNGKRIGQIEEKTQEDADLNRIINRVRASGMKPSDYLKSFNG